MRDLFEGLPAPLKPYEPIPELYRLTTNRGEQQVALVCTCRGDSWAKVGAAFRCGSCNDVTVEADGAGGWRRVLDARLTERTDSYA